jgi:N-acyl-D-aspartate/D-glutamate deacylase
VAPLLKHEAGVLALSDAGAHLIYFCDAGFGLHFLAHWVRETQAFTLEEGVRRLTSDPAKKYRIPDRGEIRLGAFADLLLFDPKTVGVSTLRTRVSCRRSTCFTSAPAARANRTRRWRGSLGAIIRRSGSGRAIR